MEFLLYYGEPVQHLFFALSDFMNPEVFAGDSKYTDPDVPPFHLFDDFYSEWWEVYYHAELDPTPANFIPNCFSDEIPINFDSKDLFIFSYIYRYTFYFMHHSFVTDIPSLFSLLLSFTS